MQNSVYHICLRTSALTIAIALLFVSGVISPVTKQISQDTNLYLANTIGMHASVLPTELNSISAELEARNKELNAREIAVSLKESESGSNSADVTTFVLSALLFVLLMLIVLNYVLDYLRAKERLIVTMQNEKVA
jgi:hypothetical protein